MVLKTFEVAHEEELHRVLLVLVTKFQLVFVGILGIWVSDLLWGMLHAIWYVFV